MTATKDRNISLDDIRYFVEVAKRGGFTAAAEFLDAPVATISRRIAQLERALGFPVLTRTTRKISLTRAGARFFEECAESVEHLLHAPEQVQSYLMRPEGKLRISMLPGMTLVLPSVMEELRESYPQISYHFDLSSRDNEAELRDFDLTVRAGPQKDSQMIQRPLAEMRRMLVASAKYLDRRGRPESPADLSKHLRIGSGDEDVWELRKGSEEHTVDVSPAFSSNSALLGLEVAASGAGIAWVPCHIAMSRTASEHGLEPVLPDWELSTIMLYALFDSRVVSARAQVFLDVLVRHLTGAESHIQGTARACPA